MPTAAGGGPAAPLRPLSAPSAKQRRANDGKAVLRGRSEGAGLATPRDIGARGRLKAEAEVRQLRAEVAELVCARDRAVESERLAQLEIARLRLILEDSAKATDEDSASPPLAADAAAHSLISAECAESGEGAEGPSETPPEMNLDFDPATTKILRFTRWPPGAEGRDGKAETQQQLVRVGTAPLTTVPPALEPAPLPDLENRQAAKQLERFRKATRKYVADFRDGIAALLGWRIEMKGDSGEWILTSCYGDTKNQELSVQCRPRRAGRPAQFDLLGTPWAEQLMDDRQAMAYLEVYNSMPAFLSHITMDLVSRQTING